MSEYELPAEVAAPPQQKAGPWAKPWGPRDMAKAVGLVIAGTLLVSVPAALLAEAFAGNARVEDDATALSVLLAASIFLELLLLFTAVWFSVRKYGAPWATLGLRLPERGAFLLTIGLAIAGLVIVYVYFGLLSLAGVKPETDVPEEAYKHIGPLVILGIISLAMAPVIEEVFFRGFIFGGLKGRWGTLLAAAASAFLFGAAHLGNPGTVYVVVPIALVGALFAYGYLYSGSLLPGMAAHLLFNFLSFTVGLATS